MKVIFHFVRAKTVYRFETPRLAAGIARAKRAPPLPRGLPAEPLFLVNAWAVVPGTPIIPKPWRDILNGRKG